MPSTTFAHIFIAQQFELIKISINVPIIKYNVTLNFDQKFVGVCEE